MCVNKLFLLLLLLIIKEEEEEEENQKKTNKQTKQGKRKKKEHTWEPCSMATRLIQTPEYYRQFCLSRRKAHTFSLKVTRLLQTPVNMDNGHFSRCVPRDKMSYIVNPALRTLSEYLTCENQTETANNLSKVVHPGS